MNRFLALLALFTASTAVTAVTATTADARRTHFPQFDITVKGKLTERWTRNVDRQYSCSPREEASGGATITFASTRRYRVTADPYTGFHGRPLVNVTADRFGQLRNLDENGNPNACGEAAPDRDGSACGIREFKARLRLPKTSRFAFGLPGDRHEFGPDCPRPPAPPTLAEDFYESTSLIGEFGSKVNWHGKLFGGCDGNGRCHDGKKRVVIRHRQRLSFPYGKPEWGGRVQGDYTAEIEWTATIRRVGKVPRGR